MRGNYAARPRVSTALLSRNQTLPQTRRRRSRCLLSLAHELGNSEPQWSGDRRRVSFAAQRRENASRRLQRGGAARTTVKVMLNCDRRDRVERFLEQLVDMRAGVTARLFWSTRGTMRLR
jgi:hypothetical protein